MKTSVSAILAVMFIFIAEKARGSQRCEAGVWFTRLKSPISGRLFSCRYRCAWTLNDYHNEDDRMPCFLGPFSYGVCYRGVCVSRYPAPFTESTSHASVSSIPDYSSSQVTATDGGTEEIPMHSITRAEQQRTPTTVTAYISSQNREGNPGTSGHTTKSYSVSTARGKPELTVQGRTASPSSTPIQQSRHFTTRRNHALLTKAGQYSSEKRREDGLAEGYSSIGMSIGNVRARNNFPTTQAVDFSGVTRSLDNLEASPKRLFNTAHQRNGGTTRAMQALTHDSDAGHVSTYGYSFSGVTNMYSSLSTLAKPNTPILQRASSQSTLQFPNIEHTKSVPLQETKFTGQYRRPSTTTKPLVTIKTATRKPPIVERQQHITTKNNQHFPTLLTTVGPYKPENVPVPTTISSGHSSTWKRNPLRTLKTETQATPIVERQHFTTKYKRDFLTPSTMVASHRYRKDQEREATVSPLDSTVSTSTVTSYNSDPSTENQDHSIRSESLRTSASSSLKEGTTTTAHQRYGDASNVMQTSTHVTRQDHTSELEDIAFHTTKANMELIASTTPSSPLLVNQRLTNEVSQPTNPKEVPITADDYEETVDYRDFYF